MYLDGIMDELEASIIKGMENCYRACHEDFANTVHMVARARGLEDEQVTEALRRARDENSEEYRRMKSSLPKDFPI